MKTLLILSALFVAASVDADDFQISSYSRDGVLSVSNAFPNGIVSILTASSVTGSWYPQGNFFSTDSVARVNLPSTGSSGFYRASALDLSGQEQGFTNLVESYNLLSTVAGAGSSTQPRVIKWKSSFEGGAATDAQLSFPHIAMADRAGNIYIADKEAHAIRKVTPDGRIFTVAGINVAGTGTTNPAAATTVALGNPNGIWVREDGTFYILDKDNGYIRKVDTDGTATVLVDNGGLISQGRGLWVSPDESVVFYANSYELRCWDTTNGLTVFATGFSRLANIAVDPNGVLYATDQARNVVYQFASDGSYVTVAGNGTLTGGGDGSLAIDTGLDGVRAIWFLPTGGYLLGTDPIGTDPECQLWYVDLDGYIHLLVNGSAASTSHSGDGSWFYDNLSALKISRVKQVTMDYDGNILITENDAGYVRKIRFLPHTPD
jgi:streptogramin lyase